jgi:hypothetical protein
MEQGINQEAMKPGRVFKCETLTGFLFLGSWIPDSSLNNQPTTINLKYGS